MKLRHIGRLRNNGGDALMGSIMVKGEVIKLRVFPNVEKASDKSPDFIIAQVMEYENQSLMNYEKK